MLKRTKMSELRHCEVCKTKRTPESTHSSWFVGLPLLWESLWDHWRAFSYSIKNLLFTRVSLSIELDEPSTLFLGQYIDYLTDVTSATFIFNFSCYISSIVFLKGVFSVLALLPPPVMVSWNAESFWETCLLSPHFIVCYICS